MGIPADQAAWAWIELGCSGRVCFLLASSPSVGRMVGQGRFVPGAGIHLECSEPGKFALAAGIHRLRSELALCPLAMTAELDKSAPAAEIHLECSEVAGHPLAKMAEQEKSASVAETQLGRSELA